MFDGALAPLRGFPVLALHGRRDPHVSFDRQVAAVDVLRTAEVDATIVAHDGGHGLRSEAGSALARFFTEVFARTP
jgi:predicted esterase